MGIDYALLGQVALGYSPMIDKDRSIMATRLTLFPLRPDAALQADELLAIVSDIWPKDGKLVSLNVASESLLTDLLKATPETNCMIEVPAFMAQDPANTAHILAIAEKNVALLLKGRPTTPLPREILPCFKYAIVDISEERRSNAVPPESVQRQIRTVQSGVKTQAALKDAFDRGAYAVLGWPMDDLLERKARPGDKQAPADLQIMVHLIRQLDEGAEVEVLENTLKRDPALAFKLLRYINSPAFGLSVEVSSFSHAIMLLGYNRLKRWVALLLATASRDPDMKPIMFASLRRGLMMEELGKLQGDNEAASELFICGVFSLLDKLFRQPFSELLGSIPMPDRVKQALIDGEGPFAPYLQLVHAIEAESLFDSRDAAEAMMLSMGDVNRAQLRALSLAAHLD